MMTKRLIVIIGPTGVGKTELSIQIARWLECPVLSADSRQFYKELKIGTARPDEKQLKGVKHFFLGHVSLKDKYHAGKFEEDAEELLPALFRVHPWVILTGGSGLYIDAVLKGIDPMPSVDPEVRKKLRAEYEEYGLEYIRELLKKADPEYYQRVDRNNPNRMLKALEIYRMTGKAYSGFLKHEPKKKDFLPVKVGLNRERSQLYERINKRVDQMMEEGLLEEVRAVMKYKDHNALNTFGYKELIAHLEGRISLEEAVRLIKRNSRHYARRQLTWFRKDPGIKWFHPDEQNAIMDFLTSFNQK